MESAGNPALEAPRDTTGPAGAAHAGVLLIVENHSVPADRRVWGEAQSLRRAGYRVSVICPRGRFQDTEAFEARDGVAIHRFKMRFEGRSRFHYVLEYSWSLFACLVISLRRCAILLDPRLTQIGICSHFVLIGVRNESSWLWTRSTRR